MLLVASQQSLGSIESALRRAAAQNGANLLTVTHVGQHLSDKARDAIVFGLCSTELYAALLAADIRMSVFLPCRIAAYSEEGRVTLASLSPLEFCRTLQRADLTPLAAPLESLLLAIMQAAAQPAPAALEAAVGAHRGGIGATEDQMNARGAVPQRIDCHGTKVEDMAGTGDHDAQGG